MSNSLSAAETHSTCPRLATQACDHLHPAHSKAGTVRRDLQKMCGQVGWAVPCPHVHVLLLLVFGELGLLWVAGNPAWRKKPSTKRLEMVPRVEVEYVWDGVLHQKHDF